MLDKSNSLYVDYPTAFSKYCPKDPTPSPPVRTIPYREFIVENFALQAFENEDDLMVSFKIFINLIQLLEQ